jgi:hypothetical protein
VTEEIREVLDAARAWAACWSLWGWGVAVARALAWLVGLLS